MAHAEKSSDLSSDDIFQKAYDYTRPLNTHIDTSQNLNELQHYAVTLSSLYYSLAEKLDEDHIKLGRLQNHKKDSVHDIFADLLVARLQDIQDVLLEDDTHYVSRKDRLTAKHVDELMDAGRHNPDILAIIYEDIVTTFVYGNMHQDLQNIFPRDQFALNYVDNITTAQSFPDLIENNPVIFDLYLQTLGCLMAMDQICAEDHEDINAKAIEDYGRFSDNLLLKNSEKTAFSYLDDILNAEHDDTEEQKKIDPRFGPRFDN